MKSFIPITDFVLVVVGSSDADAPSSQNTSRLGGCGRKLQVHTVPSWVGLC